MALDDVGDRVLCFAVDKVSLCISVLVGLSAGDVDPKCRMADVMGCNHSLLRQSERQQHTDKDRTHVFPSSYRQRHMTWNATRPVFVVESLRASVGPGQRSRMVPTLSGRTISAADYFVDEDAAAMLEYVERPKRSD